MTDRICPKCNHGSMIEVFDRTDCFSEFKGIICKHCGYFVNQNDGK